MNTKNTPFKVRKIPYNLSLIFLTAGASLILGLLSFSGMYAILPMLPLAFASFALSVTYEGEIYLQNIKGAFKKLFKRNHLENELAKEYLLAHFPEDIHDVNCPQFFKDYKRQLKLLAAFGHKELNEESKNRKKQVEKTLKDMERWFAAQLFSAKNKPAKDESAYAQQLRLWLQRPEQEQEQWQEQLTDRNSKFQIIKAFSLLSALFMGAGTTYLIAEAFAVIPFFAAIPFAFWPIMIVPMALIAGAAYGMLTLNAVTDLVNNNTILKWYNKLRDDLSQGLTIRNVFMTAMALILGALAVALTVCTAGTWWTIANNVQPIFEWMKKIPSFVMGIINPIITGSSAVVFIFQNTAESLDLVDEGLDWAEETVQQGNLWQKIYEPIVQGFKHLIATENWLQILNPFRLILKLTITPLRMLLFLGHLISIAVTADRMPGVPQIVAALIAMISEGFEDAHYFVGGHEHEEEEEEEHAHHDTKTLLQERLGADAGHEHNEDIPTWILKTITLPIYALAALWDSGASQFNASQNTKETTTSDESTPVPQARVLSFGDAWNKQRGNKEEVNVELPTEAKRPSKEWQVEQTISLIEKHQENHLKSTLCDEKLTNEKVVELDKLKSRIRNPQPGDTLEAALNEAKTTSVYNRHRLFSWDNENTNTQDFIEELPERVNAIRAMG
ncbi:efflux RND transporter permease subunit [Legionella fallonii]|nr:efflux RND transporter permease subunit [Legionella fallonii]